jgi:hypothetical protein
MSERWRYQYVEMPRKRSTRPRGRYAACPARAKDTFRDTREWYHSRAAPGLWENRVVALSDATSTADRVHFVKNPNNSIQRTCPNRAPACAEPEDHMPGDQVVISARHGALICATNTLSRAARSRVGCRPTQWPLTKQSRSAANGWLGHWRHALRPTAPSGAPKAT